MGTIDGDRFPVDELLKELDELRELDRRRHAHAPGSPDHDAASDELDTRTRRLMDRFRDLRRRETRRPSYTTVVRGGARPH
jgi:hypothetical protein